MVSKPFLRPEAVRKRLAWAEDFEDQDWGKVLLPDKMSLQLGMRTPVIFRRRGLLNVILLCWSACGSLLRKDERVLPSRW